MKQLLARPLWIWISTPAARSPFPCQLRSSSESLPVPLPSCNTGSRKTNYSSSTSKVSYHTRTMSCQFTGYTDLAACCSAFDLQSSCSSCIWIILDALCMTIVQEKKLYSIQRTTLQIKDPERLCGVEYWANETHWVFGDDALLCVFLSIHQTVVVKWITTAIWEMLKPEHETPTVVILSFSYLSLLLTDVDADLIYQTPRCTLHSLVECRISLKVQMSIINWKFSVTYKSGQLRSDTSWDQQSCKLGRSYHVLYQCGYMTHFLCQSFSETHTQTQILEAPTI